MAEQRVRLARYTDVEQVVIEQLEGMNLDSTAEVQDDTLVITL